MDIRPKSQPTEQTSSPQQSQAKEETKFKAGTVNTADAKVLIPPSVAVVLQAISKKYNLPCDLSNIAIGDGKLADIVKGTRQIADMVEKDSKLLPELIRQTKRIMAGELKLQQFHVNVTKAAIKHQEKLDRATADLFLMMARASGKSARLEHRTNTRAKLINQRNEAWSNYYEGSSFKDESLVIDAEFSVLASNSKILSESKVERIKLDGERKQKLHEYVQSAYQN